MNSIGTRKVLIWGSGEVARVLVQLMKGVSGIEVVGVCVDDELWEEGTIVGGMKVKRMSEAVEVFPPGEVEVMVGVGFKRLNRIRREVLDRFLSMGYEPFSFVHPGAYISSGVKLARHILIMPGVILEPGVVVGEDVFVWSGAVICHDAVLERDCFVASGVSVGGGARIGERSFLGMSSVVRDHRSVGKDCVVGAGVYVSRDLPDGHMIKRANQSQEIVPIQEPPI